mgnify:CR=1 FL=1
MDSSEPSGPVYDWREISGVGTELMLADDDFADLSGKNPYDDARAHRGQIRGNFVQLGFSYTPNWAAAPRNRVLGLASRGPKSVRAPSPRKIRGGMISHWMP